MLTNRSTIKHIIHEEYQSIKLDTLIKIADAFDMTIQEFLSDDLFKKRKFRCRIKKKSKRNEPFGVHIKMASFL